MGEYEHSNCAYYYGSFTFVHKHFIGDDEISCGSPELDVIGCMAAAENGSLSSYGNT